MEPLEIHLSGILENQAILNIITLGHVAHGKSTLVHAVTGVKTQKHRSELERNITIYLGYANAKIWEDSETSQLVATSSNTRNYSPSMKLAKHISFVDCPGHESLMSTAISAIHNIDVVLLLVAGNDKIIPQAQTYEHLLAISAIKGDLNNFLILQNKLDLVTQEEARENLQKIQDFIQGSPVEKAPILPISAQFKVNLDQLYKYFIHIPGRLNHIEVNRPARLTIIRSFNVNKPGTAISDLKGGVVGGSLNYGNLQVGDWIEIRPGIIGKDKDGNFVCRPLISMVTSLFSEKNELQVAVPGGLLGIGLNLDPGLTRNNRLVGQFLGHIGTLPGIFSKLIIEYKRISRILKADKRIPTKGERLKLCTEGSVVMGTVTERQHKELNILVDVPLCLGESTKIAVLRNIDGWRLDGIGQIRHKTEIPSSHLIYPEIYQDVIRNFKQRELIIINDTGESTHLRGPAYNYDQLLSNIPFKVHEKDKISLPAPVVERINKQSVFANFESLSSALDFYPHECSADTCILRTKGHLFKFLIEELGTNCSLNSSNQVMMNGRFNAKQLEMIIKKYAHDYLQCKNCNMLNSYLSKKGNLIFQNCNFCNSTCSITK